MKVRHVLALAIALSLIACGGEKKSGGAGGGKNTLVIAWQSSPTNLDIRVGNDNASGRMFDLIYSGLVRITPTMDYAPDVAEKWELPDDRTIIFHLNPNARFHNGQPVKASDVKWTYDSLMDPKFVTSKRSGYSAVDHIEAPDDHTVIFKLKQPNGGLFDNLTLGILPTGADTNVYKTKPIGCGPYKVINFIPDERLELEAFDQWHLGAPKIKHVVVRVIPDATTRVLELRRGTVNFEVNNIPFENVNEFAKNPDFKVTKTPGSIWQYLQFNLHDPILAKKEVRQAIAYAIDREKISRDAMRGFAVPSDTMFGQGHWVRAEGLPSYPFDPGKAKQLLDQAGYKDGPNGRFALKFKTSNDAEALLRVQMMQQMLQQVGIHASIEQSEFGTFIEAIGKGNFQMYSLSRNGIQDPDFLYVILFSKNVPPSGQNRGFYSNPRVDELLVNGRETFDRAKRKPIYDEIQKHVQEDLPFLSLYNQMNAAVMRKNIDGYVPYPAGFLLSVPEMSIR